MKVYDAKGNLLTIVSSLDEISDVEVPSPTDGYILYWDAATGKWKCKAIPVGAHNLGGAEHNADTLANLSEVLRERKKMKDKVQSLSSEAKSSAMIIGSLPFFVMGMISLINPEYMALLFTETLGQFMLAAGMTWMAIGIAVMSKMINFDM